MEKNIEILLEGYLYSELPNLKIIENISKNMVDIVVNSENFKDVFIFNDKEPILVMDFKNIIPPSYIHNIGTEPLNYYEFKNNKGLREMMIPNLILYIAFIYNTVKVSSVLFEEIYHIDSNDASYSASNLMFDTEFTVTTGYDDNIHEITISQGQFDIRNDKSLNHHTREMNYIKYNKTQASNRYELHIDIESFYSNIYTHYLEQLKERQPFSKYKESSNYFLFLDKYNQKINSNQTKGIGSGIFSSRVSSELLLLSLDQEVTAVIESLNTESLAQQGSIVSYLRYVDDMYFYSDSRESLEKIYNEIQIVLHKRKLIINQGKTTIGLSLLSESSLSRRNFKSQLNVAEDIISLDNISIKIRNLVANGDISGIKYILSELNTALSSDQYKVEDIGQVQSFATTLIQLVFFNETLASRVFRLIISISNIHDLKDFLYLELSGKKAIVNSNYTETLLQVWFYHAIISVNPEQHSSILKDFLEHNELSPIIALIFVKEGVKSNKLLFSEIVNLYSNTLHPEKSNWKASIVFSKWSLVVTQIHLLDGYNYHSYFESNNYPNILKRLK